MIKNLLKACALAAGIFAIQPAAAQTVYNSVATAYLQTTISQSIVFDSTMQAGGTFNFSVLAHNGGGRSGQADTEHRYPQWQQVIQVIYQTLAKVVHSIHKVLC